MIECEIKAHQIKHVLEKVAFPLSMWNYESQGQVLLVTQTIKNYK